MVLQYIAASFHLPAVSTANINTVQYPNPRQQCEIPTIPAVVVSKVLLPQSNIMAVFVHSNSSLFSENLQIVLRGDGLSTGGAKAGLMYCLQDLQLWSPVKVVWRGRSVLTSFNISAVTKL
jgi:hypothetical protein